MLGGFLDTLIWGFTILFFILVPISMIAILAILGMDIWQMMTKKATSGVRSAKGGTANIYIWDNQNKEQQNLKNRV